MPTISPDISTSIDDGILRITIDRPDRMNAVTLETLQSMATVFADAATRPEVRVVVLSGAGRAFCAGADLMGADVSAPSPDMIDAANDVVSAIIEFPRPVVAAIRGPVVGVGVSLALACDLTIATTSSYFLLAFTKVGLMPDGGATALVAASIGRARALRMALLAEKMTATEASNAGLISSVVDTEDFERQLDAMVSRIATGSGRAHLRTKEAINDATLPRLSSAFACERRGQIELLGGVDFAEGVAAFAEKRTPNFVSREG